MPPRGTLRQAARAGEPAETLFRECESEIENPKLQILGSEPLTDAPIKSVFTRRKMGFPILGDNDFTAARLSLVFV